MRPSGTIYRKGKSSPYGSILIALPFAQRIAYRILRSAGAGFLAFMFLGLFYSYGPILSEELKYQFRYKKQVNNIVENVTNIEAEKVDEVRREAEGFGVDADYSIVIPKINAYSKVIANVDAGNKDEYQKALKEGVAHAKGTYFPGQENIIYLFSHSTNADINIERYNAVFYLLRKLEKGDRIIIFFADKKYVYEVTEKVITNPKDVSWLNRNAGEELVLQTCDPPGTSIRRLIVIAKPV